MAITTRIYNNLRELGANWYILSRPEIRALDSILDTHEEIDGFVYGSCEGRMSFLLATDRRLLYVDKQFFKARTDSIPYMNIAAVEHRPGLFLGQAIVRTTSHDYEMKRVPKAQLSKFCEVAQQRMHEANQARGR